MANFNLSLEQTLTLTETLTLGLEYGREFEDSLKLYADQSYSILTQEFVEIFTIEDEVSVVTEYGRSEESDLGLEQGICVELNDFDQLCVEDVLDVDQDISVAFQFSETVEDTLDISETILSSINSLTIEQAIGFDEDISTDGSTLADPRSPEQTITLEDTIALQLEVGLSAEHTIAFTESIYGYVVRTQDSGGNPICGEEKLLYVNENGPTLTEAANITLEYPTVSPTHTVTLPAALFGNQETLNVQRIQRRTRGGSLKVYRDDDWDKVRTFRLKFDHLTDTQRSDLETFFQVSLGKKVKYTDHESRAWTCILLTPGGEFGVFFRTCGNTAEFDLEVTS